jgi:uncharacterized protein (DUF488 family)
MGATAYKIAHFMLLFLFLSPIKVQHRQAYWYYMIMTNALYTIGYASFSMDEFIHILRKYDITALADIRSAPYSKFRPEFKKDHLQKALPANGISYIFLGNLLGARVEDSACYADGKLNYHLLKESQNYRTGITRILNGIKNEPITLMCAEKDPLNCHRTFLVCRAVRSFPVNIKHILADGSCEEHSITERRLLQRYELHHPDIFRSEYDLLEEAYDRQCENITL